MGQKDLLEVIHLKHMVPNIPLCMSVHNCLNHCTSSQVANPLHHSRVFVCLLPFFFFPPFFCALPAKTWRTGASIPVPLACEASALPFELDPLIKPLEFGLVGSHCSEDAYMYIAYVQRKKSPLTIAEGAYDISLFDGELYHV